MKFQLWIYYIKIGSLCLSKIYLNAFQISINIIIILIVLIFIVNIIKNKKTNNILIKKLNNITKGEFKEIKNNYDIDEDITIAINSLVNEFKYLFDKATL